MSLSKPLEKKSLLEFYTSIEDLSIWNWKRIYSEGNLKYILRVQDYQNIDESKLPQKKLEKLWLQLRNEHLGVFGWDDSYMQTLKLRKKIGLLKAKIMITGDRVLLNFIKINEIKLKNLLPPDEKYNFMESIAVVEKFLGFRLDPKATSTLSYYTYIKMISKNRV